MPDREGVRGRLAEMARAFYESKLSVPGPSVEVIVEEGVILVRVRGFVTPADKRMMAKLEDRQILEDYYTRLAEMAHPLLDQAIVWELGHHVSGRRTILDLERSECVYLMTLDTDRPAGAPPPGRGAPAGETARGPSRE